MTTLHDIERLDKATLTVEDISPLLECGPQQLRMQARDDPSMLGFPVIVHGTRVLIPKDGFLYFMRYGHPTPQRMEAHPS